MKKKVIYIIILLAAVFNLPSITEGQIKGLKATGFAENPNVFPANLISTINNGYVKTDNLVLGSSYDSGSAFITKYRDDHSVVFAKTIKNLSITNTSADLNDNIYLIGFDLPSVTVTILKIDATGNLLWKKNIPQTGRDNAFPPANYPYYFYKIIPLSNGNVLFHCYMPTATSLLLLSSAGDLLVKKQYPFIAGDIEEGYNNTIAVAYFDQTGFWSSAVTKSGILLLDYNLEPVRSKKITSEGIPFVYRVMKDNIGNYFAAGVEVANDNSGNNGGIIVKLDSMLTPAANGYLRFTALPRKKCDPVNRAANYRYNFYKNKISIVENNFFNGLFEAVNYGNDTYQRIPFLNIDNALQPLFEKNAFFTFPGISPGFVFTRDIIQNDNNIIFNTGFYLNDNSYKSALYFSDTSTALTTCFEPLPKYTFTYFTPVVTDELFVSSVSPYTLLSDATTISNVTPESLQQCTPLLKPIPDFTVAPATAFAGGFEVCINTPLNFTDLSLNYPGNFNWTFPPAADLANADSSCFPNLGNIYFRDTGTFYVTLVACNEVGCDSIQKPVYVRRPVDQPKLGNDTTICPGDSLVIVYNSQPYSTHLFTDNTGFSSTSDTLIIKSAGDYKCTVTAACGILEDAIGVAFSQKPTAAFSVTNQCGSKTVNFTNASQVIGNNTLNYQWDFFNTLNATPIGRSTAKNPVFTFPDYDSFSVMLITKTSGTCITSDTLVQKILLQANTVAAFTASQICGSKTVSFTNNSTAATDTLSSYQWFFGGEGTASQKNPSFTFSSFGNYEVKLVVTGSNGCGNDTFSLPLVVKDKPVAAIFYDNNACANLPFSITATDSIRNASIVNRTWLVNDVVAGDNTNLLSLTKPAGNYQVKYVTLSSQGCSSDMALINIVVDDLPTVSFTVQGGCTGKNIVLQNNSNGAAAYSWQFGNGDTAAGISPVYTYNTAGSYSIRLEAISANGCKASSTLPVFIESTPIVNFTTTELCIGKQVVFTNTSSNAADSITNYTWSFGNDSTVLLKDAATTFNRAGNYNVMLTASTANGCTNSLAKNLAVLSVEADAGNNVSIAQNSPYTLQGSGGGNYAWQPATLLNNPLIANPTTILQNDQLFKLEVTSAAGCKGYDSVFIKVLGNIFIPNAFAPGGVNKLWRIRQLENYVSAKLALYNRYGQKIFEGSPANNYAWDGTFKGKMQPAGAYVYILQVFDGRVDKTFKGTLMLVR